MRNFGTLFLLVFLLAFISVPGIITGSFAAMHSGNPLLGCTVAVVMSLSTSLLVGYWGKD